MKLSKYLHIFMLVLSVVSVVNCAKKDDKRNDTQVNHNTYYMSNGQCYSNTGQQVPINYCSNYGGNGGYYVSNGQCYSSTGQVVDMTYCQNSGGSGQMQQCYGYYCYPQTGQCGQCYGSNCRGYTLQNMQTGQTVQCM